jgi:hypothetical protein
MTQEEIRKRYEDFPEPVRILGRKSPQVNRVMQMYVHCDIITMQEALCKMVTELAATVEEQQKQVYNLAQRAACPPHMVLFHRGFKIA